MEKRYQVFVSSTFTDLADERRAVMQALLELNCIPAGMEDLFMCAGQLCMDLPPEAAVNDGINEWLRELAQDKSYITKPGFRTVKIRFYALGLVRTEILMRQASST